MYRTLSWRNIPTARTLFAMIFMAGIGLIISIVALLYLSLHLISTKTNEIESTAPRFPCRVRYKRRLTVSRPW